MSTNSQSKKDMFAGLNMPIDQKPLPKRDLSGSNKDKEMSQEKTQDHKITNTQNHKITNNQDPKNTRKEPNTKGNVQDTFYTSQDNKTKIAVLTARLGKPKGEVLEEGLEYLFDKYKHLLKGL